MTSRSGPLGNEQFEYDTYDRLTKQKLDNVTFATVTYDEFSRLATVQYPAGQSLSSITRDSLGRENSTSFTLASGQVLKDEVTRSTSGDILSGIENGKTKSYTYDKAGRLTAANIGGTAYGYEFGPADASCNSYTDSNPNAGKSGNRTKQTINGVSTTYCYNQADQLIFTSDPKLTEAQYDTRGNTTSLGTTGQKTEFAYDTSDRNVSVKEADKQITYKRDVQSRITERAFVSAGSTTTTTFGFTGASDTPDFTTDTGEAKG